MNQVIPRATIEMIVGERNQALKLFGIAFEELKNAEGAIQKAKAAWKRASPNEGSHHYNPEATQEINAFLKALELPEKDTYMRVARKLIDATVWSHIISTTELERLMDKQAKDELRAQMKYVPDRVDYNGQLINEDEIAKGLPEVTVDNIFATIEDFALNSDTIFRRGLANSFSKLDRRFRSHNGFKIGDRIILNNAFDDWGSWSSYRNHRDTIKDIERAFQIIDGQSAMANYAGIVHLVDTERRGKTNLSPMQSKHEGEFFRIRIFKNGNAHLWFTNKKLLQKANKILGEWYGEVIGDADTKEADPLNNVKTTPAKHYGFFPTPPEAANKLMSGVTVSRRIEMSQLRILEPNAGTGNLADRCLFTFQKMKTEWAQADRLKSEFRFDNLVDCIEIQPALAQQLKSSGKYNKVICTDFLSIKPESIYDLVVMNPPFDRERDIDHVVHAFKFLKPGGSLHTIMSAGTEFRETKKSIAFRRLMQKLGARWEDLPQGSFSEVGTNVNTIILRVKRPNTQ